MIAVLGGGLLALATYSAERDLSVGRIELSVEPFHAGALDLYVPLVDWGARFSAVRLPARLKIDVRTVDRDAAERVANGELPDVRAVRHEARDAVASYLRVLLMVVFLCALAAGLVVALAVRGQVRAGRRHAGRAHLLEERALVVEGEQPDLGTAPCQRRDRALPSGARRRRGACRVRRTGGASAGRPPMGGHNVARPLRGQMGTIGEEAHRLGACVLGSVGRAHELRGLVTRGQGVDHARHQPRSAASAAQWWSSPQPKRSSGNGISSAQRADGRRSGGRSRRSAAGARASPGADG